MSAKTFEEFKVTVLHKWLACILYEVSEGRFTESDKFTCRKDVADALHEQVSEELEFAPVNKDPSGFTPHPWGACAEACYTWLNASDEVLWQVYKACQEEGERVMEAVLLDASSGGDPDWEWVQESLEQVFQRKISEYIQDSTSPVDMSHNLETEEGQKRFAEYCSANRDSINKRFGL